MPLFSPRTLALLLLTSGVTASRAQLENIPEWVIPPAAVNPDPSSPTSTSLRARNRSYIRTITLARPRPARTAGDLTSINPRLPELLPGFNRLMESAELSTRFADLYDLKIRKVRGGEWLTPHNYFDCETVLRLRDPESGRRVLLVQADMDVVTDGSDPVRAPVLAHYDPARTSDWFLPETSYSWAAPSSAPRNPFLDYYPGTLEKLEKLRRQLQEEARADQGVVWRELLRTCDDQIYRIKARGLGSGTRKNLRSRRFLLADRDPFVVLPIPWVNKSAAWSPGVGDYAAVIHKNRIFPAILGDTGPAHKVGEASLRLARQINPKADGRTRAVNDLTVTYLFFPRSGSVKGQPNPTAWRTKVLALLEEIGGLSNASSLYHWKPE